MKPQPWTVNLCAIAILAAAGQARAKTIEVPSSAFPTIQQAVAQANPGDVIEIDDGTYFENVVVFTPGITLRGDDAVIDGEYNGPCIQVEADGVRLEDLELINGLRGARFLANSAEVIDCEFRSTKGAAIEILGADAMIRDNQLRGCVGGILVETANALSVTRIEKNVIVDNDDADPIEAIGGRLLVRKNEVFNAQDGIRLSPTHPSLRSEVSGNELTGIEGSGISIDEAQGAGVDVRKNKVSMVTTDGIFAVGDFIVIEDNEVSWCEDDGIDVFGSGCEISGNNIDRVGGEGIEYSAEPGQGSTLIAGNKVKRAGQDGVLAGGAELIIADNKVTKCSGDGIDLVFGTNCRITGNVCSKNAHEGIDNSGVATRIDQNVAKKNGRGAGPDIAGAGNEGAGSVLSFDGNVFLVGGASVPQRLDSGDQDISP